MERDFAAPPSALWAALTDVDLLLAWHPLRAVRADVRPGGVIEFWDAEGGVALGRITECQAGRLLAYIEDDADSIDFLLAPTATGAALRLTHCFDDGDAAGYAAAWHLCLDALEEALTGAAPADRLAPRAVIEHFRGRLGS